jgi:hypothetical protein
MLRHGDLPDSPCQRGQQSRRHIHQDIAYYPAHISDPVRPKAFPTPFLSCQPGGHGPTGLWGLFEYRCLEMYDCRHDCTAVLAEVHMGSFWGLPAYLKGGEARPRGAFPALLSLFSFLLLLPCFKTFLS